VRHDLDSGLPDLVDTLAFRASWGDQVAALET
jgi:hypothetical protein